MFSSGIVLFTLPEASRARNERTSRVPIIGVVHTAAIASVAAGSVALVLLLPASIGEALLGDRWVDARAIVPFVALQIAAAGAVGAASICLRALEQARTILRLRLMIAPMTLAGGFLGASLGGIPGMALALAVVNSAAAIAMWAAVRIAVRGVGACALPAVSPVISPAEA